MVTAQFTVPSITPTRIPTIAQIKSCFSSFLPFDLSRAHLPITIKKVNAEDQKTGKNTINNITNKAEVSILIMPSVPNHL